MEMGDRPGEGGDEASINEAVSESDGVSRPSKGGGDVRASQALG